MRPIVPVLACAAIVACGSDGGELSVEEYRDQANELCAEGNREVEQLGVPNRIDGLADLLERGLALQREYERRARGLEPPERFKELHEEGLRLSDEIERETERLIDRLRVAADPAVLRRWAQRLLPEIRRNDEINRELGLDECLKTPSLGVQPPPS